MASPVPSGGVGALGTPMLGGSGGEVKWRRLRAGAAAGAGQAKRGWVRWAG